MPRRNEEARDFVKYFHQFCKEKGYSGSEALRLINKAKMDKSAKKGNKLAIHPSLYNQWTKKENPSIPSIKTIKIIATYFDVPYESLIIGSTNYKVKFLIEKSYTRYYELSGYLKISTNELGNHLKMNDNYCYENAKEISEYYEVSEQWLTNFDDFEGETQKNSLSIFKQNKHEVQTPFERFKEQHPNIEFIENIVSYLMHKKPFILVSNGEEQNIFSGSLNTTGIIWNMIKASDLQLDHKKYLAKFIDKHKETIELMSWEELDYNLSQIFEEVMRIIEYIGVQKGFIEIMKLENMPMASEREQILGDIVEVLEKIMCEKMEQYKKKLALLSKNKN